MSLDEVYIRDEEGQGASACQLSAEKKNLKSCPLCRQPLTQVMRYGRVLNKMKLDQADIQSAGQTHTQLGQAEAIYQQAAAATQSADQLVTPAVTQPQAAGLLRQRGQQGRLGPKQAPAHDPKADALLQARRTADHAVHAFEALRKTCSRPPPVAVHESTQATLQRLADQQDLTGHKLEGVLTLDPKSNKLKEVKELWAGATSRYESALAEVQHAIELAEQELAQQTGLQARAALISLQQQRVQHISMKRGLQHMLGKFSEANKQTKAAQLHLLTQAKEACSDAQKRASESTSGSPMVAVLASLQAGFASLHKLVEAPMDRNNELKAVVKALVSEVPSLAGSGFTNQGHWYECENGHPYIIIECGGATQASMCPECGAPIGGTQHRLQAGNRESAALRALAAQVAGQRL
ncbi:hypothetical protein WJX82_000134 [Trebouxia sp. C0006]